MVVQGFIPPHTTQSPASQILALLGQLHCGKIAGSCAEVAPGIRSVLPRRSRREDVRADIPLISYSLDSLVSVELRNWIRRETSVELALSAILQAENLQALSENILAQRDGSK